MNRVHLTSAQRKTVQNFLFTSGQRRTGGEMLPLAYKFTGMFIILIKRKSGHIGQMDREKTPYCQSTPSLTLKQQRARLALNHSHHNICFKRSAFEVIACKVRHARTRNPP